MPVKYLAVSLVLCVLAASSRAGSTYVGADEAYHLFAQVTAADMAIIRTKKMLISSRSYGQNMLDGITRLGSNYSLNYHRNTINLATGNVLTDMPANIFDTYNVVHYLSALSPLTKRLEDFDYYLRDPAYNFASQIDVAMVEFHASDAATFPAYKSYLTQWRADFPDITFITVTAGVQPLESSSGNEASWAFSDLVMTEYLGNAPIMDWRDLLITHADGTLNAAGHYMCPEFNLVGSDNNIPLHPNAPFIEQRLGQAFLTMLDGEVVPEPASMSLLGAAALLMLGQRRRR